MFSVGCIFAVSSNLFALNSCKLYTVVCRVLTKLTACVITVPCKNRLYNIITFPITLLCLNTTNVVSSKRAFAEENTTRNTVFLVEVITTVRVKNEVTCNISPTGNDWEFVNEILNTNRTFISTQIYQILLNYLWLSQSYAISAII